MYTVSGYPVTALQAGTVDIAVGPEGHMNCNGAATTSSIQEVPELGATISGCANVLPGSSSLDPSNPVVCGTGQVSTIFAPCVSTASFATVNGAGTATYCPLPSNLPPPDSIPSGGIVNPGPNAVFDCRTGGSTPVTIGGTTDPSPPPTSGCPSSTTPTLPYTIQGVPSQTVPAGTYYFDSANVTIDDLDPCLFSNGPVNIFILPADPNHYCTPTAGCPWSPPTSPPTSCPSPTEPANASFTINGPYVNAAKIPKRTTLVLPNAPFYPGNPTNLNLYWSGNVSFSVTKGSNTSPSVFDGNVYAPGAPVTVGGNGTYIFGSITDYCFTYNGSPTMYYVYPQHPTHFLSAWAVTHYSITP